MRTKSWAAAAALMLGSVAVAAPEASARGGWEPVEQPAFTVMAGKHCDFAWSYEPTAQSMRKRVVQSNADGSPKVVEFAGKLQGVTTNDETGETIWRSTSGRMIEHLRADGSVSRYETFGPVGLGFGAGSVGIDQGYYIFHGHSVIDVAPDGTKTLTSSRGAREDICQTLD